MNKVIVAFPIFRTRVKRLFYIPIFTYRLQTPAFQQDNISSCLSTVYIQVRELVI